MAAFNQSQESVHFYHKKIGLIFLVNKSYLFIPPFLGWYTRSWSWRASNEPCLVADPKFDAGWTAKLRPTLSHIQRKSKFQPGFLPSKSNWSNHRNFSDLTQRNGTHLEYFQRWQGTCPIICFRRGLVPSSQWRCFLPLAGVLAFSLLIVWVGYHPNISAFLFMTHFIADQNTLPPLFYCAQAIYCLFQNSRCLT